MENIHFCSLNNHLLNKFSYPLKLRSASAHRHTIPILLFFLFFFMGVEGGVQEGGGGPKNIVVYCKPPLLYSNICLEHYEKDHKNVIECVFRK